MNCGFDELVVTGTAEQQNRVSGISMDYGVGVSHRELGLVAQDDVQRGHLETRAGQSRGDVAHTCSDIEDVLALVGGCHLGKEVILGLKELDSG